MFYPHARPLTRAVHSLEHLATLSDAPSLSFCFSERTAYVLQNLAVLDAVDSRRYARLINPYGYVPVAEEDEEWALFQSTINNLCLELIGGECEMPKTHIWAQQPNAQNLKKAETNILIFPTVNYDELGGEYNPADGRFTAIEAPCYYRVRANVLLAAASWPLAKTASLWVYQTGIGAGTVLHRFTSVSTQSQYVCLKGSATVRLASPGDTFYIGLYHDLAADTTLYPWQIANNLWIDRLA